jgi:DNA repair protein RecN (Recombination protein N)
MLAGITIENLAIIDKVTLDLGSGLNVLTGETGAGKSIIIDAFQIVLGGRCSSDVVREGAARAVVEAFFDSIPASLADRIRSWGFECEDSLVLSREVYQGSKSIARINGRLATAHMLREVGSCLVDVHGQGEHQQLLDTSRHIVLLDSFAGPEASTLCGQVTDLVGRLAEVSASIREFQDEKARARQADLLQFQLDEVAAAKLREGEEEELARERRLLSSAQKLLEAYAASYDLVCGGAREQPSAAEAAGRARSALADASRVDQDSRPAIEALDQAIVWLEEAGLHLRRRRDSIRPDPQRLSWVEDRLAFIAQMKRKYGDTIAEIVEWTQESASALDRLRHAEERVAELRQVEAKLLERLGEAATRLSGVRRDAAQRLSATVAEELDGLGMKDTRFEVRFESVPDPSGPTVRGQRVKVGARGADAVEFLLSPNPGEPLRPLAKIASGGEMSRIMLALKAALARTEGIPVLVFDEIDAGIGGDAAYAVGSKLAKVSEWAQVLCVTHLAQIAAFAESHIVVSKHIVSGRSVTSAHPVEGERRLAELSRMIGGSASRVSLEHAKEILEKARGSVYRT